MQSSSRSLSSRQFIPWALALLTLACIFVGTLMPVGPKNELLRPFPAHLHPDKLGHFLGFALLSASLFWTGRVRPVGAVALAAVLGAATEVLQFFAVGRMGRLTDIGIDVSGGLLGVALAFALLKVRALREQGPS